MKIGTYCIYLQVFNSHNLMKLTKNIAAAIWNEKQCSIRHCILLKDVTGGMLPSILICSWEIPIFCTAVIFTHYLLTWKDANSAGSFWKFSSTSYSTCKFVFMLLISFSGRILCWDKQQRNKICLFRQTMTVIESSSGVRISGYLHISR